MTPKALQEKPESQPLAAQKSAPLGLEEIGPEDLILPRIILLQGSSKFVKEDGLRAGTYASTLTRKNIKDVGFVPFYATKYVDLLRPEGNKMVFEERVTDANDPRLKTRRYFNKDGMKADAKSVIAVFAINQNQPVVITFSKTGYHAGKELLTLAKAAGGPFWLKKYRLDADLVTSKDGETYYIPVVSEVGPSSIEEQEMAYDLYVSIAVKAKTQVQAAKADADEAPF